MCSNSHSNSWTVFNNNNNNTSNCNLYSSDSKNSFEIIAADRFTNNNSQHNLQNIKQNRKTDVVYSSFDQYFQAKLFEYNEIEMAKKRQRRIYENLGQLITMILLILASSAFVLQYLYLIQNTSLSQPTNIGNFTTNITTTTYPVIYEGKPVRKLLQSPTRLLNRNTSLKTSLPKIMEPISDLGEEFDKYFRKSRLIHIFSLYFLTILAIALLVLHNILLERNRCRHNFVNLLRKIHNGYQQMINENKRRLFEELPFYVSDPPNSDCFKEKRVNIRRFQSNFQRVYCKRVRFLRRQLKKEMASIRNMKNISQQSRSEKVHQTCRKYMQQMRLTHAQYMLQLNRISEVLQKHQQRREAYIKAAIDKLEKSK